MNAIRNGFASHAPAWGAWVVLLLLLVGYFAVHPRGLTIDSASIWSNQVTALAFVAIGQAIVVFTRGLDLSIGAILALTNCLASTLVSGTPLEIAFGVAAVIGAGAACGLINGFVVVFGRIQAIIATIATGAVFTGIALLIRPIPGGSVDEGLSDILTYDIFHLVPSSLVLLAIVTMIVWSPIRCGLLGRTIIAAGSHVQSAYMSGLPVHRARIVAFVLAGIFASFGGLFLGLQTLSGDANSGIPYTLNSIAAVVLGGVPLSGGAGSVLGVFAGAAIIRTLGGLLFFTGISPLAQPFIQGAILGIAVAASALRLLRTRNQLEVFR
jgi:ribose transport system permease protein